MDKVRNKLRGENSATLRECARVEEPGKEEGAVSIGGQLDAVKCNSSGKHALLILGRVMTLKARSHGSGTVSSLSNLPHLAEHGLEDEIVEWGAKLEAALQNIVSVLVEE